MLYTCESVGHIVCDNAPDFSPSFPSAGLKYLFGVSGYNGNNMRLNQPKKGNPANFTIGRVN